LKVFFAWCEQQGLEPLPPNAEITSRYILHLVEARRTVASINGFVTALAVACRLRGYKLDRAPLAEMLKGVRRLHGAAPRQARPLLAEDMRRLVELLDTDEPADLRDAALLTVAWCAALRQSEAVGLDWERRGTGTGFVRIDKRGIELTLVKSKTSQDSAVKIVVPVEDAPTAAKCLARWAAAAKLSPGQPIFRAVSRYGQIAADRLAADSVARIIKRRVQELSLASGADVVEAKQAAAAVSGHSARAGYCTSAALHGLPEWKIRNRSRHRSAAQTATYVRAAESWRDSGLRGIGF
jgi:integrase